MQDVGTGAVVNCRITEAALRMLSASPVHGMQTMFERHRRAAEALASAKFDAGQRRPVVTLGDLSEAKLGIGAHSIVTGGTTTALLPAQRTPAQ